MNRRTMTIIFIGLVVAGGYGVFVHQGNKVGNNPTTSTSTAQTMTYTNDQYKFNFSLPQDWKGYSVVMNRWKGNTGTEEGPLLLIRNPKWTAQNPYQDIPIMVFTLEQWNALQNDQFHIGAAPINPTELGRNDTYVFALPARYNFAYQTGWEEVQQILDARSLHAF